MLRFIVGDALADRQARMHEIIGEKLREKRRVLLVVPRQSLFSAEKEVLFRHGEQAQRLTSVLSLQRMAHLLGADGCKTADSAAKAALMTLAVRDVSGKLEYYKNVRSRPDFIPFALQSVTRLKEAGLGAEQLTALEDKVGSPSLKRKLHDLACLLDSYSAVLGDRFFDSDDDINRLCAILENDDPFGKYCVFFDSFLHFTESEYKAVRILIKRSSDAYVSLIISPEALNRNKAPDGMFRLSRKTANKLRRMAREDGVGADRRPVTADPAEDICPYIKDLHDRCAAPGKPEASVRYNGEVRLRECSSRTAEAEAAAADIFDLVRRTGIAYRDIAVIARDVTRFRGTLDRAFSAASIPYFWDNRKPLSASPVCRFLLNSLRCASQRNTDVADSKLLSCLKSGFFGLTAEEACEIENEAFRRGYASFKDFSQKWDNCDCDNNRKKFMDPISKLQNDITGAGAKGFAEAAYRFLLDAGVKERLEKLRDLEKLPRLEAVITDPVRAYNEIIVLLETFCDVLGGTEPLEAKEYTAALSAMADSVTLGEIPQTSDCVQVGSAGKIRPGRVKAVFLLGANEEEFPAAPAVPPPFTASENRDLLEHDVDLGDTPRDWSFNEELLVYSSLFCSSRFIYASCCADGDSGSAAPSRFFEKLRDLLPKEAVTDKEPDPPDRIFGAESLLRVIPALDPESRAKAEEALRERGLANEVERLAGLKNFGVSHHMDHPKLLFNDAFSVSDTKLKDHRSCRFKFLCRHGLRVEPDKPPELDALKWGNAAHAVLCSLLVDNELEDIKDDFDFRGYADKILTEKFPEIFKEGGGRPARTKYFAEKFLDLISVEARRICENLKNDKFRPEEFEKNIGEGEDDIAPLKFEGVGCSAQLTGKIDRLDIYNNPENGKRYLRVVDYKTGSALINKRKFGKGEMTQAAYYLEAVKNDPRYENCVPAAVKYQSVASFKDETDKQSEILIDELAEDRAEDKKNDFYTPKDFDKIFKDANGLDEKPSEDFELIFKCVNKLAEDMARLVSEGDFNAEPAEDDPCKYCDYLRVCYRASSEKEEEEE